LGYPALKGISLDIRAGEILGEDLICARTGERYQQIDENTLKRVS